MPLRILRSVVSCTVLLALGVALLLRGLLPRFLYFPEVGAGATPGVEGCDYEALRLRTEDDVELSAWYLPGADPTRAALWFHGNAGNLSDRVPRLRRMAAAGVGVLAVDYRGYGLSSGAPSPAGTAADARAAWRWLVEERDLDPGCIAIFGSSLGAAVALQLAVEVEDAGLVVLESPFLSVRAMARHTLPLVPGLLVPNPYDNAARMARLRTPLLIYHGDRDEVIPFEQGRALFGRAASPQRAFVRIPGGRHLCLEAPGPQDYFAHFCAALRELSIPATVDAEASGR